MLRSEFAAKLEMAIGYTLSCAAASHYTCRPIRFVHIIRVGQQTSTRQKPSYELKRN